jgi:peroxiredoxin
MAATSSTMMPLGTQAPSFRLLDPSGQWHSLDDFRSSPVLLVAFICNHCPFVKHIRAGFVKLADVYGKQNVAVVAISSNDVVQFPDDGPAKMAEEARQFGYKFPYLFDETQEVAKAYGAACTPDFFIFDKDRKLAYRGQMDDSRPDNGVPVTGKDLAAALDALLAGRPVDSRQKASIGCNIKWKAGQEPEYARAVVR